MSTVSGDGEADELMKRLRLAASELDPVPAEVLAAARGAFAWRRVNEELAELTSDSALELAGTAGVRGEGEARLLSFAVEGGLEVELEVSGPATGLKLLGQTVPATPGLARVSYPGGAVTGPMDELGRFSLSGLVPGPARIELELSGEARRIVSDSILL